MEDNAFTRRMQHFYPGKEIFEIFYRSENNNLCVYVIQFEKRYVLDAIIKPKELLVKEENELQSWEGKVVRILGANKDNILLH